MVSLPAKCAGPKWERCSQVGWPEAVSAVLRTVALQALLALPCLPPGAAPPTSRSFHLRLRVTRPQVTSSGSLPSLSWDVLQQYPLLAHHRMPVSVSGCQSVSHPTVNFLGAGLCLHQFLRSSAWVEGVRGGEREDGGSASLFLRSLLPLPRWQDKLHLPSGTKGLGSGRIS